MRIQDIIARKRDGESLSPEEIRFFVDGYTRGGVPDYQAAALLMAIYLRGMSDHETTALTVAMAESGVQLDLSSLPGATVDKHSTGGVGDKTSLVVVPILAAAGVSVCKMSGRGLGHTGGTLDKLESIPAFRVALSPDEMVAQVRSVGACLAGQTPDLAPADRLLYALRDATATVGSLPLIVSSILSKKLAGGARSFLFDVKVGSGALLRTDAEAVELACALVRGAAANGRRAVAVLTDMGQPLGTAIGNALEIREAILTMTPGTAGIDPRWHELCIHLSAEALQLIGNDKEEARERAERLLGDGSALNAFRKIVAAQGGDVRVIDDPDRLPTAPCIEVLRASKRGYISRVDAATLGNVVVELGGGRRRKEDPIDHGVGMIVSTRVGDAIAHGDVIAEIHAPTYEAASAAAERAAGAFSYSADPVAERPLIRGREAA